MKVRTMTALGATAMLALAGFAGPAAARETADGTATVGNAIDEGSAEGSRAIPRISSTETTTAASDVTTTWGVGQGNPALSYDCESEEELPS